VLSAHGWLPSRTLDLNAACHFAGPLAPLLAGILAAMIGDLVFYVYHRAQHAVPWLWRLHAVHHSIRDMNAVNSYHHISEGLVSLVLRTLPLTWLNIHAEGAAVVGVLFALQVNAIHCPTTLHAGRLRWLLVDNRFHRIHHSLNPRTSTATSPPTSPFGTCCSAPPISRPGTNGPTSAWRGSTSQAASERG
jgi:sterol desaturase/sphingolipid hydroxylase (fatty acid hydroxylase superfamily)